LKKRRSDKELTIALCVSLALHTVLLVLLIHEKIELLMQQLSPPRLLADAHKAPRVEEPKEKPADEPPAAILQPIVKPLAELDAPKPPPPPPPPEKPKKPSNQNDENIEWGEKNAKGIAINSAPGKVPLSARKGMEDQSAASRDPEGPEAFEDDPSMSTVPPGENGDGRKPVRDPLAGKGTAGNPSETLGNPNAPVVPPAPLPKRTEVAALTNNGPEELQGNGKSVSQSPVPEKRSPAEANVPAAERDGLPNDPAQAQQILPIKQADVIGIDSNELAYPDVVEALTRPPGLKVSSERSDAIESPVLPSLVSADVISAPSIQPATAALQIKPQPIEEMALKLREADPRTGPAIVEAMMHSPGEITHDGGPAALPELAPADVTKSPEILDAIAALPLEEPRPQEMAQQPEQGAETPAVAAKNEPAGQTFNATGGVPGPTVAAADPAPDTGFESDPFAKIPGVDFHDGKVEARSGRQVKPIRPHLSDAGRRDLLAMNFPTVVFKVRIDKTGKVKDVSVIQGSGSEAIDMPVYRALWEWWFEPPKDKKGNALEDVQLVSIHWG
jgi:TonB family protein